MRSVYKKIISLVLGGLMSLSVVAASACSGNSRKGSTKDEVVSNGSSTNENTAEGDISTPEQQPDKNTEGAGEADTSQTPTDKSLKASYSFEDIKNYTTYNAATKKYDELRYVFSTKNQELLAKPASDPLTKKGVSGKSLYMDGFSTQVRNGSFKTPSTAMTLSAWVAPRVFENMGNYGEESARAHPRLTSVINQGDIEMTQGFCLGYGRLGLWGIQLALYNASSDEQFVVGYYDPINTLPLYEWSHIAAVFDGDAGYIALLYNGETVYESLIPEFVGCEIVENNADLIVGGYSSPVTEYSIDRQMVSGLLDEVKIYDRSLTPREVRALYSECAAEAANLDYAEIALDSSVYEGDRNRPQYHAIPPAVWMNEPHSPFYYKGRYHVFYQSNPSGPYWMQIRWSHIVSDDMIHWKYVKDAVVPTKGVCPEGVWTGGACIGPDGTPWLAITAGTNQYGTGNPSGQNLAFAHAANPDDPDLTDWIVEDKLTITQPNDNSQGEREQFRDPFVWYDDETRQYFMLISTSIPEHNKGGSANIYTSKNMHEWEHKGYVYDCPYPQYDVAGEHWECVVLLPVSNADGSITKYVLFDCPQYARGENSPPVECYYWIGKFDKNACRFIPDNDEPQLFDYGTATFTGQNGFCYLTDEQRQSGMVYEQGRTILYSIAQGKDAGTTLNYYSGWAHNFGFPLELSLSDDGKTLMRKPIKEIESLYGKVEYEYGGGEKSIADINADIADIRGDTIKIDINFTVSPEKADYAARIGVRYNLFESHGATERTYVEFSNGNLHVDRLNSTLRDGVAKDSIHDVKYGEERTFDVTILLDRSMMEVYVNGVWNITARLYPHYGDSDHIMLFDDGAGMKINSMKITQMKSAFSKDGSITAPYYGNTGTLEELIRKEAGNE